MNAPFISYHHGRSPFMPARTDTQSRLARNTLAERVRDSAPEKAEDTLNGRQRQRFRRIGPRAFRLVDQVLTASTASSPASSVGTGTKRQILTAWACTHKSEQCNSWAEVRCPKSVAKTDAPGGPRRAQQRTCSEASACPYSRAPGPHPPEYRRRTTPNASCADVTACRAP